MSEFKDSVESFKQTFTDSGFSPAEEFDNIDSLANETLPSEEKSFEDGGEVQASEGEHQHRKRRNKNPFQKRVDELSYKTSTLEQNNFFLQQQLEQESREKQALYEQLSLANQKIQSNNKLVDEYYDTALTTQEESIKEALKKAKLEGDVDEEIKYQEELSTIKAKKTTSEFIRQQQLMQQQMAAEQEEYVPYRQPITSPYNVEEPQVDPEFYEWISENSWYEENPQLRAEADQVAEELAKALSINNQSHMIGTSEFRDSISNIMRDKYAINRGQREEAEEEELPYSTAPSRPAVAPVTRPGMSMADQYMARNPGYQKSAVSLSEEEYNIARNLQIPTGGRYVTGDKVLERYQQAKKYPKSPHQGGTPYRLTIL